MLPTDRLNRSDISLETKETNKNISTLINVRQTDDSVCYCDVNYISEIYTKIPEVNLFAFAYRLFREDFSSILMSISLKSLISIKV